MNMGLLNMRVWGLGILCILFSCRQDASSTEKNAVGLDSTMSKGMLDTSSVDVMEAEKVDSMHRGDCDLWTAQILAMAEEDYHQVFEKSQISDSTMRYFLPYVREDIWKKKSGVQWMLKSEDTYIETLPKILKIPLQDGTTYSVDMIFKPRDGLTLEEETFFKMGFMTLKCEDFLLFILIGDCGNTRLLRKMRKYLMAVGLKEGQDFYWKRCGGNEVEGR